MGKRGTPSPDANTALALPAKVPRLDHPGSTPDFSSSVKKKLQSSSRTGQACDRCKVRVCCHSLFGRDHSSFPGGDLRASLFLH